MALLRKVVSKGLQASSKNAAVSFQIVRTHFNRDYMPGPFPKTEEERKAAAKKYDMLPEEYKPYPDDGFGYGDYPKMPEVSAEAKDPFYNWDFPEHRRNFNEPIHVHADAMGEDRWNVNQKFKIPFWKQITAFVTVFGGTIAFYYWSYDFKIFYSIMPKQLPAKGTHYTFEPAE